MDIMQEIEIMFANINKDEIRAKLKSIGARLKTPEYRQFRIIFDLIKPEPNKWIRVRDEGDKITLAYKEAGRKLEEQKEVEIFVDSFEKTVEFLKATGHQVRSIEETKREKWVLGGVEITIDTWPFLEPVLEIEGESQELIQKVSEKLGFDYEKGYFCTANVLYKEVYGKYIEELPVEKRILRFDSQNPF